MRKCFGGGLALCVAWSGCAVAQTVPTSQPETVVVIGETPRTQTLIDRKVYTVTNDLQSHFGTAADLLNNIPSVTVDTDGNVSLRNDSNVTILIDGKPSSQFSGSTGGLSLLQLPASEIERIEVMSSPPASVKANGSAGVINIITKKHRQEGFSGAIRGSVGERGRFVAGADFAYNAGRLKTTLGIGLREDVRDRLTRDARVIVDPPGILSTTSSERVDETIRRLIPSVKASISYAIDDKQTFGATFSHRNLIGDRGFLQQDLSGFTGDPIDSITDRLSRGHEWDTYEDQALTYDRELGPDQTLSLSLTRSTKREDEKYGNENTFLLPVAGPTFDTLNLGLDFQEIDFSADYSRSFASLGTLKLGYDLDTNNNLFDNSGYNIIAGVLVVDPAITNAFRYRNRVNAAYGEFDATVDSWHVDAGLRYETNQATTLLVTTNVRGRNSDSGIYPSLHVQRSVSDEWNLLANISRRITRPNPEALNPFVDTQDTQNLRAGNSSLLPQDTWLYEVGYGYSGMGINFGSTVYYRFDRNSVTDVVEPVNSNVVLIQKENLPKMRSFGLELETDGKPTSRLSYSLSANAFYMQIDARALGASGLESTAGVNFKAEVDYRITANDVAQITLSRTDRRLTPQGTLGAVNLLNLGFKHEINAETHLVATVSDLLNGQVLHRVVSSPQLNDDYQRLQYGRIFYVGIVYGFGAPLNKKADEINYDQ